MVPFAQRLELIFDSLDTTPYRFAGDYGFGKASLFNMVGGRSKPNLDMLERLCAAEPRISAEYLLRGEGEPLRDAQLTAAKTTVEELKTVKAVIEKRIEELGG